MIKKILLGGFVFILFAISNSRSLDFRFIFKNRIPLSEVFWEEYNKPYKLGVYDCSQKAAAYYWALKKEGYNPEVWVVWVTEGERVPRLTYGHAIVKVGDRYYDPTNGDAGIKNINHFGRKGRHVTEYELRIGKEWELK